MDVQPDFKELLESFNSLRVEYLIVGGYALAFHGAPRFTGDLDLWVNPTAENARRVLEALDEFGFGAQGLTTSDFEAPDRIVQLGVPPVRIDLITTLSGVSWEAAWTGSVAGEYGDVTVRYIGRDAFLKNKRATGRSRDLADIEALGER